MGYTERIWDGWMRCEGRGWDGNGGPLRLVCVSLCDNSFVLGVTVMVFGLSACMQVCGRGC